MPVDHVANSRALLLATGTAVVLLAAVMVVALNPPRSSAPSAIVATTLPAMTFELRDSARVDPSPVAVREQGIVRTARDAVLRDNGLALVGAPNAVSAAPVGDADDFDLAGRLPGATDHIVLLTDSHTFDLTWSDVFDIEAPDGAIVMTRDGQLLATFMGGELRLLVK